MQQHTLVTAQRLLNLYRQEHVIEGGWAAVNEVFLLESNDENVITALASLPTGAKLVKHIKNLRSGKTPMNSIEVDLLPYGGMMFGHEAETSLSPDEINQLQTALDNFETTPEGLNKINQLPFVKKFGHDWVDSIKPMLANNNELLAKWDLVSRTDKAYRAWNTAKQLTSEPLTERSRAQIQADMLEFETYLPMFGEAGKELLTKLRTFMSII